MVSVESRPQWIPVQEMVPEGSIGADLISQIPDLGVRLRPKTTFNQPIQSLWDSWDSRNFALRELEGRGIEMVADVTKLSAGGFSSFLWADEVESRLQIYLEELLLPPHSKLVGIIFEKSQPPIDPKREKEIVSGVDMELSQLRYPSIRKIMALYFGLDDGITRTFDMIARVWRVDRQVTRQTPDGLFKKGLSILRHPLHSRYLGQYLILPKESFGAEVFKASLAKDLPPMSTLRVRDLKLPESSARQLRNERSDLLFKEVRELLMEDLGMDPQLSEQTRQEIAEVLRREADKGLQEKRLFEKAKRRVHERIQRLRERWQSRTLSNNLLPEIAVTPDQMVLLRSIPIDQLGLSTRVYNLIHHALSKWFLNMEDMPTAADVLNLSRKKLAKTRNLGRVGISEILGTLQQLLQQEINTTKDY